jgi:long-chain acyl-CoA synthetase
VELRRADDGEIQARGESIFRGYHKDPEATAAAFTADGWLRTGDLGAWTDDGFLRIVGRKKEILVTAGGKNVPPANIELRFADDPLIARVVVYGDGKPCLVAGVWLDPSGVAHRFPDVDAAAPDAAVRRAVGERIARENETLAKHERIRAWKIVDEPLTVEAGWLTPTLKVRRNRVYAHFGDLFEALYERPGREAP